MCALGKFNVARSNEFGGNIKTKPFTGFKRPENLKPFSLAKPRTDSKFFHLASLV